MKNLYRVLPGAAVCFFLTACTAETEVAEAVKKPLPDATINYSGLNEEETAALTAIKQMLAGMRTLNFEQVLATYAPDAVCVDNQGKSMNMREMESKLDGLRRGFPLLRRGLKNDNLSDIMEGAGILTGQAPDEKHLAEYRKMSAKDQSELIAMIRPLMSKIIADLEKKMASIVDSVRIINVSAAGGTAIVETTGIDGDGRKEKTTFRMENIRGKWLITKSVAKLIGG